MAASAAMYYLWHKYIYEYQRDNYEMDMLRAIASAYLKEPPTRYYDMIADGKKPKEKEYTVNDVVDMFAGTGVLV